MPFTSLPTSTPTAPHSSRARRRSPPCPGSVRVWHSANWKDGFGAVAFVNAAHTELVEIYVNINMERAQAKA